MRFVQWLLFACSYAFFYSISIYVLIPLMWILSASRYSRSTHYLRIWRPLVQGSTLQSNLSACLRDEWMTFVKLPELSSNYLELLELSPTLQPKLLKLFSQLFVLSSWACSGPYLSMVFHSACFWHYESYMNIVHLPCYLSLQAQAMLQQDPWQIAIVPQHGLAPTYTYKCQNVFIRKQVCKSHTLVFLYSLYHYYVTWTSVGFCQITPMSSNALVCPGCHLSLWWDSLHLNNG